MANYLAALERRGIYMNKVILISALLITAINTTADAGERVDKSASVSGIKSVSVENIRGKVKLQAYQGDTISITGELDDETERFIFEPSGNQFEIRVELPKNHHGDWQGDGSDLTIKIPENLRVFFQGVSSHFTLSGFDNDVDGRTVSGDINASQLKNDIELETVSGDVIAKQLSGKVKLATVSGDIEDNQSQGRLTLKTVSGDITSQSTATEVAISAVSGAMKFDLAKVDELKVKSVSGSVTGNSSLNQGGRVKVSAVSSNITLGFQQDLDASFKVVASAGGRIDNQLTNDKVSKAKYGPSSKLKFTTGDGSSHVKISVVSGKITLHNN